MSKRIIVIVTAIILSSGQLIAEGQAGVTARKILNQYQDAMVRISAVYQMRSISMQGDKIINSFPAGNDKTIELTGVMIDEDGLVVCSLRSLDISETFNLLFEAQAQMIGLGQGMRYKSDLRLLN